MPISRKDATERSHPFYMWSCCKCFERIHSTIQSIILTKGQFCCRIFVWERSQRLKISPLLCQHLKNNPIKEPSLISLSARHQRIIITKMIRSRWPICSSEGEATLQCSSYPNYPPYPIQLLNPPDPPLVVADNSPFADLSLKISSSASMMP